MIDNFTLIIGAQKCGTTSLFKYLSQHPQISPCRKKEPSFFAKDEVWERGWDWYCSLWEEIPDGNKTALEASPGYTIQPAKSAARIASVHRDFRFIYIMRNPLERVESALHHGYYKDWGKKRRDGGDPFEFLLPRVIDASKYAKNIGEYYQRFPSDRILLLQLEDLKREPNNLMAKVCRFLEIDSNYLFTNLNQVHNPKNSYREDTSWKKLKRIKGLKFVSDLVPGFYKARLRDALNQPPKDSQDTPPPLTHEQKEKIFQELHSDLNMLKLDYGVDIEKWGFDL